MNHMLAATLALSGIGMAQHSDVATIERRGGFSTLSVDTFRPLDVVATSLEAQFGIAVGAEDPSRPFKGDLLDISTEDPTVRAGTMVPARWGFQVRFAVKPDGSPQDVRGLLSAIVAAANEKSAFAYRLDRSGNAYLFVPTRTRDAEGRPIAATPLLDRAVTIPPGIRRLNESAMLMAKELSRQTGLRVSCCQSVLAGYPWGMESVAFAATNEPARSVLRRLGLSHWHVRCDSGFCFIDLR